MKGSEEGKVAAQGHIGSGDSADNQVENARASGTSPGHPHWWL